MVIGLVFLYGNCKYTYEYTCILVNARIHMNGLELGGKVFTWDMSTIS